MNAKRQKLQDQFVQSEVDKSERERLGQSNIFAGVAIYVNGYTSKILIMLMSYLLILIDIYAPSIGRMVEGH